MSAGGRGGVELQHIAADIAADNAAADNAAADSAAGRVHQPMVADRVAFRIQVPQHAQRAVVAVRRGAAFTVVAVVELQVAVPAHGD